MLTHLTPSHPQIQTVSPLYHLPPTIINSINININNNNNNSNNNNSNNNKIIIIIIVAILLWQRGGSVRFVLPLTAIATTSVHCVDHHHHHLLHLHLHLQLHLQIHLHLHLHLQLIPFLTFVGVVP
jgi:hypothetical protein